MKILLDHNLKQHLTGFHVETARERGWSDLVNGELLSIADGNGFDILLTADSNLKKQQNFSNRAISGLVLRAYNNRLATHLSMIDDILLSRLLSVGPGEIIEVFHRDMTERDK